MNKFENFKRGVNLGGWLSQCVHTKEHYDSFIIERDVRELSTWNIDHLRVPVDYDLVETADGEYKEEGFEYIQNAIDWCKKYHLNMILDLHKTFGYSFDDGEEESGFFENGKYQERFYKLWEQFAERFGKYEDMLAFELLNEVTDKEYCDTWNKVSYKCIERIRKIAPTINILVGGYYNNSAEAVKDLAMPYDNHIVYNFHCYEPLRFTHQGAYWMKGMDVNFRMDFADSNTTVEYFDELWADAIKTAEERGVKLYCGEYGAIDRMKAEDAYNWYCVIHKAFEKHDIGHAAWSYKKMDFGLTDDYLKRVKEELF